MQNLRQVKHLAQAHRGIGNAHGQNRIAGFGRGDQVAHGADAADARHEGRHLVVGPAFAEFFEAAELGDVEVSFFDVALLVQVER